VSTSPSRTVVFKHALATAFAAARAKKLPRADAEDVASRAVTKLFEQVPFPDNPDAWVTTTAQRMAIDVLRAQKRARKRGLGNGDADEPEGKAAVAAFVRTGTPVSAAVDRDAVDRIWLVLEQSLSPREIELLKLTDEQVPQDEIAELLGYKNANTVKSTLVRIRRRIEDELEQFRLDQGHPRLY
jgi:RNA polymerase sigma factor (sigma-70 family)